MRASYDRDPHIDEISDADLLGDYPAVRYYPPSGDLYFDVLTRLGEMARFETVESEIKDFAGTRVPVATPAALYRLKKGTVWAKDRDDDALLDQIDERRRVTLERSVQKFRSIEEMNAAPVATPSSSDIERFLRHCARWWAMAPRVFPRGVFRFRTIEEAQRARARHAPRDAGLQGKRTGR